MFNSTWPFSVMDASEEADEDTKVVVIEDDYIRHAPEIARFAPPMLTQTPVEPVRIVVSGKNGQVEYQVVGHEAAVLIGKRVGARGRIPI